MAGYRFYYTDQDGIEWPINDESNWYLDGYDATTGFGILPVDVPTERRPYRDGEVTNGQVYTPSRTMGVRLQGYFASHSALAAAIRTIRRRLNTYKYTSASSDSDLLGTLRSVTPDGLTRNIRSLFVESDDAALDGPLSCRLATMFYAPNPWFYDPTEQSESYALTSPGGVTFPIDFDQTSGVTFAESNVDTTLNIQNDGDVETWPTVKVYGPGVNPTITNDTTGKLIALTAASGLTLDSGDYTTINMDAGTVNWYDSSSGSTINVIEKMSDASTFWPIIRGGNQIHVEMSSANYGSVVFNWYNRYQSL